VPVPPTITEVVPDPFEITPLTVIGAELLKVSASVPDTPPVILSETVINPEPVPPRVKPPEPIVAVPPEIFTGLDEFWTTPVTFAPTVVMLALAPPPGLPDAMLVPFMKKPALLTVTVPALLTVAIDTSPTFARSSVRFPVPATVPVTVT